MINDDRQATDNAQAEITLGAAKGYGAKEYIDAEDLDPAVRPVKVRAAIRYFLNGGK